MKNPFSTIVPWVVIGAFIITLVVCGVAVFYDTQNSIDDQDGDAHRYYLESLIDGDGGRWMRFTGIITVGNDTILCTQNYNAMSISYFRNIEIGEPIVVFGRIYTVEGYGVDYIELSK
jgi:hypothetical protein